MGRSVRSGTTFHLVRRTENEMVENPPAEQSGAGRDHGEHIVGKEGRQNAHFYGELGVRKWVIRVLLCVLLHCCSFTSYLPGRLCMNGCTLDISTFTSWAMPMQHRQLDLRLEKRGIYKRSAHILGGTRGRSDAAWRRVPTP